MEPKIELIPRVYKIEQNLAPEFTYFLQLLVPGTDQEPKWFVTLGPAREPFVPAQTVPRFTNLFRSGFSTTEDAVSTLKDYLEKKFATTDPNKSNELLNNVLAFIQAGLQKH